MSSYLIQKDGEVVEWSEDKLRRKLREDDLTGLELARREDEPSWQPLHDLEVYRQEVPHVGDPRNAARRRMVRGFAVHLAIYGTIAYFTFGVLSIPGAIWGLFVLGHASRALPVGWALLREGALLPASAGTSALPAAPSTALPPAPSTSSAAEGVAADIAEIRTLLERSPNAPVHQELARMAESIAQLDRRIDALGALLEDDVEALAREQREAQQALADAERPADRALRQRQVEVLEERQASEDRARRTLERLELRRHLAEQQVRQLRLDLVRAEADEIEPEDLDQRLERIRLEAEATEEVESLLAR